MSKKRDRDNDKNVAWLILGILFLLFTFGGLYVVWLDYIVASAFQTFDKNIWASIMFPAIVTVFFLILTIISFRKYSE